jgi:hypothetical protein
VKYTAVGGAAGHSLAGRSPVGALRKMPLLLLLLGAGASHFHSADPPQHPAAQCALTAGQDLAPDFHIDEPAAAPAACCALCANRACCHAAVFLGGTCYVSSPAPSALPASI